MASAPPTLDELKRIIIDSLNLEGLSPGDLGDEQALFGGGLGLDSVDALELMVALEKRLGIKIRSHEMDPAAFASPAALQRFLETRLGAEQGAAG